MERYLERVKAGVYGTFVADAVGVPAEFKSRTELKQHPVTDMVGYGTYNQPRGTWSDDSSMMLCLLYSLTEMGKLRYHDIMDRFLAWYDKGEYTPWGVCFDCGMAVSDALSRYRRGGEPVLCGGTHIRSNGNGSLMRILPMAFYAYARFGEDPAASGRAMEEIHKVSALTHRHPISLSACGIYVNIATRLLAGMELQEAMQEGITAALKWYDSHEKFSSVGQTWHRIVDVQQLQTLPEEEIRSSGYVVDTLEAALWCLLNTDNYRDCVLKAVNLGEDTDTVAAVAGGLAGLAYGFEGIPADWRQGLAAREEIDEVCEDMACYMASYRLGK